MTDTKQTSDHDDSNEPATDGASANEASAQDSAMQGETSGAPKSDGPEGKAEDYYNRLVRTMADFENFKKRAARERMETARYACSALLERLLPVLDNLEMAMTVTEKAPDQSMESLKTGVGMVLQQFKSALKESGLEEIEATGQSFDPNLHEAVSQQETADVPEGHIAMQLRRGYKLYDRLLRPASVVVAKSPAAAKSSGEDTQGKASR